MRHFAAELKSEGYRVIYRGLNDGCQNFEDALEQALKAEQVNEIIVTHPGEYRVLEKIQSWQKRFKVPVDLREDDRFLCPLSEFKKWAAGKKSLRMEFFYRK